MFCLIRQNFVLLVHSISHSASYHTIPKEQVGRHNTRWDVEWVAGSSFAWAWLGLLDATARGGVVGMWHMGVVSDIIIGRSYWRFARKYVVSSHPPGALGLCLLDHQAEHSYPASCLISIFSGAASSRRYCSWLCRRRCCHCHYHCCCYHRCCCPLFGKTWHARAL